MCGISISLAARVEEAFLAAGLEYRVVGGLAAYVYVEEAEPDAGRLTKDIDIVVRREDFEMIKAAVERSGLQYRHVAGVDMLVQAGQPSARRAVHLHFSGETVRAGYAEPVPELGEAKTLMGVRLISPTDLVTMKLTSFQAKDEASTISMDSVSSHRRLSRTSPRLCASG